jgi:hypothetical protein
MRSSGTLSLAHIYARSTSVSTAEQCLMLHLLLYFAAVPQ